MDFIIKNEANKHLIILVHGFNGGDSTWRGGSERFVETLSKDVLIQENFNLAIFTYGTKIFKINWFTKLINTFKGFLSNRSKEKIEGFNVGIENISRPLETEVRDIYEKYNTITFVSHSMGGLVTKSAMTWLNEDARKRIELFIFLSVPHIGASLANIGSGLFGDNPQIIDLQAMGAFTTQLNERFANLNFSPKVVYQGGHQDTIVPRQSAVPPNVPGELIMNTADDHFSVLLINDSNNNIVYNRIIKELNIVLQPFLGIEIYVVQGTPFEFLVNTIASRFKLKVDLSCFSKDKLNMKLRSDTISSTSMEDFFLKIGNLVINKFPEYSVKRERGTSNYIFYIN